MIIDSHVHLNRVEFLGNEEQYIKESQESGVNVFFNSAWDIRSSLITLEQAEKFECIKPMIGIHPNDVVNAKLEDLIKLDELLNNKKVIAVGEIGLDYHYSNNDEEKNMQKMFLVEQLKLANKHRLPVCIHCREAINDTLEIIKKNPVEMGGVFHCFSGSVETAKELEKLNFMIGIGGTVTFKNAKTIIDVVREVPLTRILVETDAPFLAPHPYRGKQNHSKYLPLIIEKISQIKNINTKEVEEQILSNTLRLFHVKQYEQN